jgi:hypothetical protein
MVVNGLCQLVVDVKTNSVCGQPIQNHARKPAPALDLISDRRFKLFDPGIATTVTSTRSQKSAIKQMYNKACLFCGVSEEGSDSLSIAHVISYNEKKDYSAFGPPTYDSPVDLNGPRNKLLLCGNKTIGGSCHNLFDYHNVALIYNSLFF